MAWQQLTVQDMLAEFSSQEQAALAGQNAANPLPSAKLKLDQTVARVRGAIIAGGSPLGPDGFIPDQLAQETLSIAAWRWLSTAPMLAQFKSKDRADLYKEAQETIRDVSNGKIKVELPDMSNADTIKAVTDSPSNQIQVGSVHERSTVCTVGGVTHNRMRGLI